MCSLIGLFEYPSLRCVTLQAMGIMFAVSFLYYAPFMIVGQFGLNFYMNGVLLDIAELITYFITVTSLESEEKSFSTLQ